MDLEEKDTADFVAAEANGDAHHVFMQSWTARVTSLINSTSAMKSEANTLPGSPTGSIGLGNKSNSSNLNKSYARRIHRRRMVADCKSLRAQIYEFEQEFTKKYGRAPKTQDRGPLQTVYSKYRDLKREIRDGAATDIQRVIRGYNDRKKLRSENRILFHRVIKSQHSTAMDVSSSKNYRSLAFDAPLLSFSLHSQVQAVMRRNRMPSLIKMLLIQQEDPVRDLLLRVSSLLN